MEPFAIVALATILAYAYWHKSRRGRLVCAVCGRGLRGSSMAQVNGTLVHGRCARQLAH